jgi:hypothetical protein
VIAKICTDRPRGLSVGFASEFVLSGSVTVSGVALSTIFIADAHRGDGKRFVVHAEEKPTAFLELERVTRESFRFRNAEQFGTILAMQLFALLLGKGQKWIAGRSLIIARRLRA